MFFSDFLSITMNEKIFMFIKLNKDFALRFSKKIKRKYLRFFNYQYDYEF
jgi:hypothetical protein